MFKQRWLDIDIQIYRDIINDDLCYILYILISSVDETKICILLPCNEYVLFPQGTTANE